MRDQSTVIDDALQMDRGAHPNAPSTAAINTCGYIGSSCRAPQNAGFYCGLSQVPTFLPESFIVMFMPWAVALIAPV